MRTGKSVFDNEPMFYSVRKQERETHIGHDRRSSRAKVVIFLLQFFILLPIGVVLFEFWPQGRIDEQWLAFRDRHGRIGDESRHSRLPYQNV